MKRLFWLSAALLFVCIPIRVEAQEGGIDSAAVRATLARARDMLVQHYKPKLPIQNYKPSINARFVPVQFDSCNLKWKLVAPIGRGSLTMQVTLNLADLDPSNIFVLLQDMRRRDRWAFELRTLGELRKIKVERIVSDGTRITERNIYSLSRAGFGADSQEAAQKIADDIVTAIKQCSETR